MRTDTESLFLVISGIFIHMLWFPTLQTAVHGLTNPAYRQPVFGGDRVGRFMSD